MGWCYKMVLPVFLALAIPVAGVMASVERDRLEEFMAVTGFDVALESIALSVDSAPAMLGLEGEEFVGDWRRVAGEVFEPEVIRGMGLDILEETLTEEMFDHAIDFYAGDLGQRLVAVENLSHMETDDAAQQAGGARLIAGMTAQNNARLELLQRMNQAIDSAGTAVRAVQEIQLRFLLAANAAGVVELRMGEGDLRARMTENEDELREALLDSTIAGAAWTYRDISDADLLTYVEVLETDQMRRVYELMNAVQYELMANRFEHLAARLAGLQPEQDI